MTTPSGRVSAVNSNSTKSSTSRRADGAARSRFRTSAWSDAMRSAANSMVSSPLSAWPYAIGVEA